ncbi:MAG: hypothetical protein ABJD68_18590, partial [Nakamurella sp.]
EARAALPALLDRVASGEERISWCWAPPHPADDFRVQRAAVGDPDHGFHEGRKRLAAILCWLSNAGLPTSSLDFRLDQV